MQKAVGSGGIIPMKKYLLFDALNVDNPKKKILEFNTELNILTPVEVDLLNSLLELIKNKSFYHSSKVSKQGFELVKKLLTQFPADKTFPSLDIYRMFLIHPSATEHYKVFENAIEYLGILIGHLREEASG